VGEFGAVDTVKPTRVCCGPRCGAEPGHRLIFAAVEREATRRGIAVVPTLCRGACGRGVTVIAPDGGARKVSDVREAKTVPFLGDRATAVR